MVNATFVTFMLPLKCMQGLRLIQENDIRLPEEVLGSNDKNVNVKIIS